MKECEAPESNKTDAGPEWTRQMPNTTSGASCAYSMSHNWLCLAHESVVYGFRCGAVACSASSGTDLHSDRVQHSGSTSCLKRGCWAHYSSLGSWWVVRGVDSGSHTAALVGIKGFAEEKWNPTD
jgi:hypothetical protein